MKKQPVIYLAAVTAIIVVAAVLAIWLRQSVNQAAFSPAPLFPDLAARSEEVDKLVFASPAQTITVARDAKGGWIVDGTGGWAANFDAVRKAILALSNLRAVERRTNLADNHAALSLTDPAGKAEAGRAGLRVTAYNKAGGEMAAVIVGKLRTPPDGNRPAVVFVRRAGEDQSYLAEGDVNYPMQISDVLDRMLFDVVASRIMSATVTPPSGPAFDVRRNDPKAEFAFTKIPKGQEPVLDSLASSIAETIALLTLENALPATQINFTGATKVTHRLFDGLVLNSETVKIDNRRWTKFSASFDVAQAAVAAKSGLITAHKGLKTEAEVKAQVEAINARTSGWAFMLPGMRATDLMRDMKSLFRVKQPRQSAPPRPSGE